MKWTSQGAPQRIWRAAAPASAIRIPNATPTSVDLMHYCDAPRQPHQRSRVQQAADVNESHTANMLGGMDQWDPYMCHLKVFSTFWGTAGFGLKPYQGQIFVCSS
jgi:hypothetical protein